MLCCTALFNCSRIQCEDAMPTLYGPENSSGPASQPLANITLPCRLGGLPCVHHLSLFGRPLHVCGSNSASSQARFARQRPKLDQSDAHRRPSCHYHFCRIRKALSKAVSPDNASKLDRRQNQADVSIVSKEDCLVTDAPQLPATIAAFQGRQMLYPSFVDVRVRLLPATDAAGVRLSALAA